MEITSILLLGLSVLILLIAFAGTRLGPTTVDSARLARIEHKLDRVLHHLGLEEERQDDADIHGLVREGAKIHAIKLYKQRYGVGLKEAKDAVDAIWREEHMAG